LLEQEGINNYPDTLSGSLPFKDTESVAEQLKVLSGGRIKTGVYHADIAPKKKESLHEAWREGKIKVVCATIGDGIHF